MESNDFIGTVLKRKGHRTHKISNSVGTEEVFRWYCTLPLKNKLTRQADFSAVIRAVNLILQDKIIKGVEVTLPESMGKLELRKQSLFTRLENNRIKTNLPIDWKSTLELWEQDEEAFLEKRKVRREIKYLFRIFYNKYTAAYKNKSFYQMRPVRSFKIKLKERINNEKVDAPLLF